MPITLATAISDVRDYLDEPNAAFWTDQQLTNWINQGAVELGRRVEWKRAIGTIPVVVGTQTYTAPTDVYRIHRVDFAPTSSDNTYTLEFRGYMEMDQIWGINQQWPASYPLYYTLWGVPPTMSIITYPVSSQAGTMHVFYYQHVTGAVLTTDLIDVLEGWSDAVVDFAVYRALQKDSDPRWQDWKTIFEEKLVAMTNETRTFQDQAGTFTTGQAALPVWLVSDGLY